MCVLKFGFAVLLLVLGFVLSMLIVIALRFILECLLCDYVLVVDFGFVMVD